MGGCCHVAANGLDELWKWGVEVNAGQQAFGNIDGSNCFSCVFSRPSHPHYKKIPSLHI